MKDLKNTANPSSQTHHNTMPYHLRVDALGLDPRGHLRMVVEEVGQGGRAVAHGHELGHLPLEALHRGLHLLAVLEGLVEDLVTEPERRQITTSAQKIAQKCIQIHQFHFNTHIRNSMCIMDQPWKRIEVYETFLRFDSISSKSASKQLFSQAVFTAMTTKTSTRRGSRPRA